jgi:hypothetical protein
MKLRFALLSIWFLTAFLFGYGIDSSLTPEQAILELQVSHINANVPDSNNFELFLKRDLLVYFKVKLKSDVTISFDYLRKGPTQSGVAYPKYYLWVIIKGPNCILDEGAVRVAAIQKGKFEITDFLSKKDIIINEELVGNVFPKLLVDDIINRAKH